MIESHSPELIVLAATRASSIAELDRLLGDLRDRHQEIPVLLGGPVLDELSHVHPGVMALKRLEEAVPTAEQLFGVPAHALS
jgi:hypothetical protein